MIFLIMSFRTRLREQIDFLGLLDKEVAAKAGISKRSIDSYVGSQASMPSADVAVKLAKALNVTVEYLVTGKNPTQSQSDYPNEIKKLVAKYKKLSKRDKALLAALIDAMEK